MILLLTLNVIGMQGMSFITTNPSATIERGVGMSEKLKPCEKCKGTGMNQGATRFIDKLVLCQYCKGTGEVEG